MPASARYYIYSVPVGYSGSSQAQRILQSGKITSANASTRSQIVEVPAGLDLQDMLIQIEGVYGDATAKTGHGFAFLHLSEPGVDPVPGGAEKPVDDVPRFLLRPPFALFNTPGASGLQLNVRKGQRFAIQATDWPL